MTRKLKSRKADGSIDLRVDLKPDIADVFIEIVNEQKFPSYAEAVRYCIKETSTKTEFHLEEVYWNKVKQFLNFDIVKTTHHIHGMQNFVNKALERFFDFIENSVESILSFDIRAELIEDELNVALAFISCQEESSLNQATAEEVAKHMGKRNMKQIEEILEKFTARGILSRLIHQNIIYYHAKAVRAF